jgi:microcystin-dependent protein
MSESYIGQLMLVGFQYAPRGWLLCDGKLLSISQFSTLFSLLGTTYGGDGRTTFALPDLRGRVPLGVGMSPGTSFYAQGQVGGVESITLTQSQLPPHTHTVSASSDDATTKSPTGALPAATGSSVYSTGAPDAKMAGSMIGVAGAGAPIDNRQPYLALNWVICYMGIFPSRN